MSGLRELEGRVALVTGAARNIGRAICLALADAGAAVAVNARNDREGADEVVAAIRAKGGRAAAIMADVTDEVAVNRLVSDTVAELGRLDILVNNAAVRRETVLAEMSFAEWREILAVILDGAYLTCRAALPHLKASGAGAIINIGGLSAYLGAPNRAHVVAAKAGLDGLTKALAHELAGNGITVNLVSPGLVDTKRGGHSPVEPAHHLTHATLIGRRGRPEEIAAWVRHLAGPDGRYMTGQTIHVNGGAFLP